jgi:hypothetical protein
MSIPAAIGTSASGQPNAGDQANAVLSGVISAVGPTAPFAFRGPMNVAIWDSINTSLTTTVGSLTATVGSAAGLAAGNAIDSVNLPRGTTIGSIAGTGITLALAPRTQWGVINASGQVTGAFPTDRLLGATVTVPSTAEGVVLPANTTVEAIIQANVPATDNGPGVPGIIQLSAVPTSIPTDPNPRAFQFALTGNGVVAAGADANATFTGSNMQWNATIQLERSFDGGLTYIACNLGSAGAIAQWVNIGPVSFTFGEPEKQTLYRLNCLAYVSGTINYRISQTGGAAESLAIGPLT